MFLELPELLNPAELDELRQIGATAKFVDGRATNPHSKVKQNLILADQDAYKRSSQIMFDALRRSDEFNNWAFPKTMAQPWLTKYAGGGTYGVHTDVAFMQQPGSRPLRSDLSCTIYVTAPETYEGGELVVHLGTREVRVKGAAGSAVVYPSNTLHEVTPVTSGERLVGLTFIESRIASAENRDLLYELNEVAALEGLNMSWENYTRLQRVQMCLLRNWAQS
ncbi:MAG: Fe2+-dependent dioxygenase [Sphingomonadaceae bacterium]|nr:Fe2+-dependent dioxygenase [Sphingomonadaceae bacterium]